MKKLIIAIIFISLFTTSQAAVDMILHAVMQTEARYDAKSINPRENAVGILQIRPIMIKEVNRILALKNDPRRFTLADRMDSLKSTQIWYVVQGFWNPKYDLRTACLVWNGRGKDGNGNIAYYNKIVSLVKGSATTAKPVQYYTSVQKMESGQTVRINNKISYDNTNIKRAQINRVIPISNNLLCRNVDNWFPRVSHVDDMQRSVYASIPQKSSWLRWFN